MNTRQPLTSIARLTAGALFEERYRIERHLGSGGMGAVYQARDERMGRRVALKILKVHPDPEVHAQHLARFEREARVVSQVRHPNVVTVFDIAVTAAGQPYLVMECIEGRHLLDVLAVDGGLAPRRVVELLIPALDALGRFHAQGIVHRDLKPRNLMIQQPGSEREAMVLLDFGIARWAASEQAAITRTGQFLGTLQYCAPEYITQKQVSPALDVYHMGLILVEMLSGRSVIPVDTDAMAAMSIHLEGALELPPALMASPFGPVIQRAVAHDPRLRYADANALREAMQGLAALPGLNRVEVPRERAWASEVNPDLQNTADLLRSPIEETSALELPGVSPSTDPKTIPIQFDEDDKTLDVSLEDLARMEAVARMATEAPPAPDPVMAELEMMSIESTSEQARPLAHAQAPAAGPAPAAPVQAGYPAWAIWVLLGLGLFVLFALVSTILGLVALKKMEAADRPAAIAPSR